MGSSIYQEEINEYSLECLSSDSLVCERHWAPDIGVYVVIQRYRSKDMFEKISRNKMINHTFPESYGNGMIVYINGFMYLLYDFLVIIHVK